MFKDVATMTNNRHIINYKKDNPLVSVIIACHNAESYITECLSSIIEQTYENIEIIICDDNSSDDSFNILKEFSALDKRIILLRNEKTLFAAETRNRCIRSSSGSFLVIQDIDDKSLNLRIETLLEKFEENIDFVSSGMICFDPQEIIKTTVLTNYPEYPQKIDFLFGLPFCHAATMFRSECIRSIGGYRVAPETKRGQDYDLFMRLYANGFKGKNILDVLYWYRLDSAAIQRRNISARFDECKLRYHGFKQMGLLPWGIIFVLKPLVAHIIQLIKYYRRAFINFIYHCSTCI